MRRLLTATALLAAAAPIGLLLPLATPSATATAPPALGTVYVAQPSGPYHVFGYAPGTTGNMAPVTDITGAATDLYEPTSVAVAKDGSLWVGGLLGSSLLHFAAGATGNVAPLQNISGPAAAVSAPDGVAVAADGSVWIANNSTSTVERFAATANGNATPLQVIAGSNTQLADPESVALTPDGSALWVQSNGSLAEFSTTANGNVAPIRSIAGPSTDLQSDEPGLAVALDGSVWAATYHGGLQVLLHFAAGANGNATPVVINGGASTVIEVQGVALDADGDVWVSESPDASVVELPPNATSDSAPLRTISGGATGLGSPWDLAIYGYQPSAPTHLVAKPGNKKIGLSWSAPSATGGAVLGYLVQRQAKPGDWTTVANTTTTSVSLAAHNGTATHLRVLGFNEYGYGAAANTAATARTKPGTPRHLKAKTGTDSVTLRWSKPTSNGGAPIKTYVVTMSPCPANARAHCKHKQIDVTGSKHKLVVKHLVDRAYHFQIRAKNVAGLGPSTKKIKAAG